MPDNFGCYVPMKNRGGAFNNSTLPTRVYPAQALSGNGSPEGVVPGNPGQSYTDLDNNNLYLKIRGTQTIGWQLVGVAGEGTGGGTTPANLQLMTGATAVPASDPSDTSLPAFYVGTPAAGNTLYFWNTATQAWVGVITNG